MASRFLERFTEYAIAHPEKRAFSNTREGQSITYGQLEERSNALAAYLVEQAPAGKPIVVYGHKSPLMLVSFLAGVKAGLGYAPVDVAYPADRVQDIIAQIGSPMVVDLADAALPVQRDEIAALLEASDLERIFAEYPATSAPEHWVADDSIFYLLFTSGSTGRPKGVMMPSHGADSFMDYFAHHLVGQDDSQVCFNRVPYTFDVSLFDILPGLSAGCELFALEAECESNMAAMFQAMSESGMTVWISTPSFAEVCMVDPSFNKDLLPKLECMVLCGEVFRNSTGAALLERFPGVRIYNTYGPTETQAVSDILLDDELVATIDPLPVGYMNPEVGAHILDPETLQELPVGEVGEVYLSGATLSLGYFGRDELTEAAFADRTLADGTVLRCYKTGDKGYLDEQGRLYCLGRLDFQVKLNGFRVELGDVERHLVALDEVENAVVLPVEKQGKINHLAAHVVLANADLPQNFKTGQLIRTKLKETLPEYMVPKKVIFHDEFAMNVNGKVDRKALATK